MKYEFVKNEDDGLSVYLPYKDLFNETYNPDGYEEFPEVEIVFNDSEDKSKPSKQQIKALDFFLKHSFEYFKLISEYIFNERELLIEKGFQIEELEELQTKYRFTTIYIDDEYKDNFSFIGMTGICSWDEEHGFGVVLLKKEILDFGDWNCGYSMYNKFSSDDDDSPETLIERRKKIKELSQTIEIENIDNIDNYLSLLKWLIDLKAVYGYRSTKLDLNEKEIVALIRSIDKLDLSNKNIEKLHENFNLLINLKVLELEDNKISELPDEICEIDLNEIYLSRNNLKELPKSFEKIKNLEGLYLSNNDFYFAPDWVGNLTNLRVLHLSGNNISGLPKSYENLENIEILYISDNKLTELPDVVKSWVKLKFLHVEKNQIKNLPSWFGKLKELWNVNLSANELVEIPTSIAEINELRFLNLRNNKLHVLPNEMGKIQSIDLESNLLTALPKSVQEIQIIKIKNNKISKDKLIEYRNFREGRPPYFSDDFNDEIRRIEVDVNHSFIQKPNEGEPIKNNPTKNQQLEHDPIIIEQQTKTNNKSGCLGVFIFVFLLLIFIL